jgi:hypothetical protein
MADMNLTQAEAEALLAARKRALDRMARRFASQARQAGAQTNRDMKRMSLLDHRPRSVRHARTLADRLAPGAGARTAPNGERERCLSTILRHMTFEISERWQRVAERSSAG